jgi:hypothetical protein
MDDLAPWRSGTGNAFPVDQEPGAPQPIKTPAVSSFHLRLRLKCNRGKTAAGSTRYSMMGSIISGYLCYCRSFNSTAFSHSKVGGLDGGR